MLPLKEQTTEEQRLRDLCQHYQGDVYAMASALGMHRTTVTRKLKSYGIAHARKKYTRQKSSRVSQGELPSSQSATVIPLRPHSRRS